MESADNKPVYPQQPPPHDGKAWANGRRRERGYGYRPMGGGRIAAYYLSALLLNILLAVYLLYAAGMVLEYDWSILQGGVARSVVQTAFEVVLLISPLLLTLLFNRILFRLFRGRRRFPRGTALVALLLVFAVQGAVVYLILSYGFIGGGQGFSVDTVTALIPS